MATKTKRPRLTNGWALVRMARKEAGLTQAELAKQAGTSQSAIASYERGRTVPSLPTLERIAQAAGLELRITLAPIDHQRRSHRDTIENQSVENRIRSNDAMDRVRHEFRNDDMSDHDAPPLDAGRIITALAEHDVDYVLVGGLAATAHGVALTTQDVDIVPLISPENVDKLCAAMNSLGAKLRVEDHEPLDGFVNPAFIKGQELSTWRTEAGDFHIIRGIPKQSRHDLATYDDLLVSSSKMTAFGARIHVGDLGDIITSKRTLGRDNDLRVIPDYERVYDQQLADKTDQTPKVDTDPPPTIKPKTRGDEPMQM